MNGCDNFKYSTRTTCIFSSNQIYFNIDVKYGTHVGNIGGIVTINGNSATGKAFALTEKLQLDDTCKVALTKGTSALTFKAESKTCLMGAGQNVYFDGVYKRE